MLDGGKLVPTNKSNICMLRSFTYASHDMDSVEKHVY